MRPGLPLVAITLAFAACVSPSNPYDPEADPAVQARARLSGRVVLEDPNVDVSTLDVEAAALILRLVDDNGDEQARLAGDDLDVGEGAASFLLPDLVPGSYRLLVENLSTRFVGASAPAVELSPGAKLDLGDLRYVAPLLPEGLGPGSVKGDVVIQEGAAVPRTVELFRLEEGAAASVRTLTADAGGRFSFTGLVSGRYAVVATAEGYAPAYALDLEIGEQPGAELEVRLEGQSALALQPVTAVLRFADEVPLVEGVRYTRADAVDVELLAFGGTNPVTGMRVSTSAAFVDESGAELPFQDHAARVTVALPDVEGTIDVHAQFEARSAGGFAFLSPIFSAQVVRDTSPPEVGLAEVSGAVVGIDGRTYLTAAAVAPSLVLDASDAVSAVSGLAVVEASAAPAPDSVSFDDVTAPGGLVRLPALLGLSGGDGVKSVWAFVRDRAGNVSAPLGVEVVVDTTPPTLASVRIAGGAEFVLSPFVSVEVESADEDVAEVALARAGAEPTAFEPVGGASIAFALEPGDGTRGVVVRLRDFAGNVSGDVTDEVVVDAGAAVLAPSLVATRDVPVEVLARAAAEARVVLGTSIDDGLSLLAAAPYSASPPATLTAPSDGAFRVFAQVRDAAGTESGLLVADVEVDTTGPSFGPGGVVVDQGAAATRFVSVTVAVDAVAPEDVEAMAVATDGVVDAETFQPFSPQVTAVLAPGDCPGDGDPTTPDECNRVCVVLRDAAGNVSSPSCDGIRLDTTPPTTPAITPLFATVRADTVEIIVTEPATDFDDQEVGTYEITSPAGDYLEVQGRGPFRFRLRPNRQNELCVRGKDEAGNVGIEDCAVVDEKTARTEIGNGIDNRGSDVFGDFIAFVGRGGIFLHDIRQGPPASSTDTERMQLLTNGLVGSDFIDGPGESIRMAGDARTLIVAHGPVGGQGGGVFNVVVKVLDDRALPGGVTQLEGQLEGSAFDVDGRYVAYFATGGVYLHDLGIDSTALDTTARIPRTAPTEALVSAPGVELCPGTAPRVARGVVIWCELQQGRGVLRRAYTDRGDPQNPNDDVLVRDELTGAGSVARLTVDTDRFHQPVLSERFIVWVEEQGAERRLVFLEGGIDRPLVDTQRRETPLPMSTRNCGSVDLDQTADLSGSRLAFLTTRDANLGLNDVGLFDFDAPSPKAACLTEDLAPQDIVSIDGGRVIYRDAAANESMVLVELSRTRWISATLELGFEPLTSGADGVVAWLETRPELCQVDADCETQRGEACVGGACTGARRLITLLARDRTQTELGDELIVTQNPIFLGPSEADPTYAVGGERVAWLESAVPFAPPPYTLHVATTGSPGSIEITSSAARVLAVDPEGTRLAFVEHTGVGDPGTGRIRLTDVTGGAPTHSIITTEVVQVPYVDLERTAAGQPVVVWQRGGDIDRRDAGGELYASLAGSVGVEVAIVARNGDPVVTAADVDRVRGPKVARVGNDLFVAYLLTGAGPLEPHACRLDSASGARCVDDEKLSLRPSNVRDVSISRDGLVAFMSDEEGVDEVVLFDVRARRRVFATPVTPSDGDRGTPDIAEGHLVWSDASLGTPDVFELVLRP